MGRLGIWSGPSPLSAFAKITGPNMKQEQVTLHRLLVRPFPVTSFLLLITCSARQKTDMEAQEGEDTIASSSEQR